MLQSDTKTRKLKLHERILILLDEIDRADGHTCDHIAAELSKRTYAGDHHITPAAINAAMSGISTRAHPRNKHYVTDGRTKDNMEWWNKRRWRLTPDGRTKVKEVHEEIASGRAA